MADEDASDEAAKALYRTVLEDVGEGKLAEQAEISVADAFRIANKLDVSVVERPVEFNLRYSMRDIGKLVDVSRSDWAAAMISWRASHNGLSTKAMIAWCAASFVSWNCLFRTARVADWIGEMIPTFAVSAIGYVVGFGVAATASRFFATLTSSQQWDAYSNGYTEGLRQGVNRALKITPEQEEEMWDDLSKADLAESHLDRRRGR